MNNIAQQSTANLRALITNSATKLGLSPAIVEKDFWVVVILDYLFSRSPWKKQLSFKGGTSLSKAFGLIKRFSEDIDLILDWRLLGYGLNEPWNARSNTQQDLFNVEANNRAAAFLRDTMVPRLKADLELETGKKFPIHIDERDPNTVIIPYPCEFEDETILREVRLESGALAAWTPASYHAITPYVAEQYPRLFQKATTEVYTVEAERTFWEKVTILHKEAMRTEKQRAILSRYSRHYYDIWCMCNSPVRKSALNRLDLLKEVVDFKHKFYRCTWAKYELATAEQISLMPPSCSLKALTLDYQHMQNMIFGPKPPFETILAEIKRLESDIHSAATMFPIM